LASSRIIRHPFLPSAPIPHCQTPAFSCHHSKHLSNEEKLTPLLLESFHLYCFHSHRLKFARIYRIFFLLSGVWHTLHVQVKGKVLPRTGHEGPEGE
jgi:hypothetical protein